MLIALRGHWGEPYPWHTRGGDRHRGRAARARIPFEYRARSRRTSGRQIREALDARASHEPVALLLSRDLMEDSRGDRDWQRRSDEARECIGMLYPDSTTSSSSRSWAPCAQELLRPRPPPELLLPAARDGPRLVDRPRPRAVTCPDGRCRRPRRRRLGADEPRRADDARALPADESRARRLRQREPALDGRLRLPHDVQADRPGRHRARRRLPARAAVERS